jgi:hypothetical protein
MFQDLAVLVNDQGEQVSELQRKVTGDPCRSAAELQLQSRLYFAWHVSCLS